MLKQFDCALVLDLVFPVILETFNIRERVLPDTKECTAEAHMHTR